LGIQIYQLPEFQEVFYFPNFDSAPQVLSDVTSRQNVKASGQSTEMVEILMTSLGEKKKSPYLIVCIVCIAIQSTIPSFL